MNDKHDAIEAGTLNVDGATLPDITGLLQGLDLTVTKAAPAAVEEPLHSLLRRPRRRRLLLSVASNPPRIP